MSIEQIESALVDLPEEQFESLLHRVATRRTDPEPDVDPVILERARRTMDDIKSGRANAIVADEVLDMLDRMAS